MPKNQPTDIELVGSIHCEEKAYGLLFLYILHSRLTSDLGSRKVVDDSDDDEVIETKAAAPKPKAPSQPYALTHIPIAALMLIIPLKEARSS